MSNKQLSRYVALLQHIVDECNKIDKDTEWQEVEPEWWLMMTTTQRMAMQHKSQLEKKQS